MSVAETTAGVVLGCGIAGLAFAAAAHRLGFATLALEASPDVRAAGSGLVLGPTALQALDFLGVRDAVIDAGQTLSDGLLTDLQLRPLSHDAFAHFSRVTGQPFIGIERAALVRILAAAAPACRTGVRYAGVANAGNGVRVTLQDGECIDAPWAVLADGIRSTGRAAVAPIDVRDAGQWCWRGVADGVDVGAFNASFREAWGFEWRYGLVGLGGGRTYWFVTRRLAQRSARPTGIAERRALLLAAAAEFPPLIASLVAATPAADILENRLEDLPPLPRWHRGRLVCIGDTAHAMTPNLGQGATQALEDAVTLAVLLQDSGGDMALAADRFAKQRKPRAERAVRESRLLGAMAHAPRWVVPLRNALLRRLPRRMSLAQLAWAYAYEGVPRWQGNVRD